MATLLCGLLLCGYLPDGASGKRTRDPLCAAKSHTRTPEKETKSLDTEKSTPPGRRRSGEGPANPNTSENNSRRGPLRARMYARQDKDGFFSAETGNPAHLVRRLLMAGDIESNPGPGKCSCGKTVRGESIRCTWCSRWIHQRCSGLSKADLKKMRGEKRYAFECATCLTEQEDHNKENSPPPGDRVEHEMRSSWHTPPVDSVATRSPPPGDRVEQKQEERSSWHT